MNSLVVKPPLKWLGNKTNMSGQVLRQFRNNKRLVEPFCGSCAVALNSLFRSYHLADSNSHLINFYDCMAHGETLGQIDEFFVLNTSKDYYMMRSQFNDMQSQKGPSHAASFYYLNRHCFRGVMRYNSSGRFNTPYGNYKRPVVLTGDILNMANRFSGKFHTADFQETLAQVENGDTVYIDPPYIPLSKTSNFTEYTPDGTRFHNDSHILINKMAAQIVSEQPDTEVVVSNHDALEVREIYSDAMGFVGVEVPSRIDNGKRRGELLIIYRGRRNNLNQHKEG